MNHPFVAVLMGSDSDLATVQETLDVLDRLQIPWQVKITSAHRTPNETREFIATAESGGCAVFIAAAGLAAHLAGTVAAHRCRRVEDTPHSLPPYQYTNGTTRPMSGPATYHGHGCITTSGNRRSFRRTKTCANVCVDRSLGYSNRSATTGSTFAARRAGT